MKSQVPEQQTNLFHSWSVTRIGSNQCYAKGRDGKMPIHLDYRNFIGWFQEIILFQDKFTLRRLQDISGPKCMWDSLSWDFFLQSRKDHTGKLASDFRHPVYAPWNPSPLCCEVLYKVAFFFMQEEMWALIWRSEINIFLHCFSKSSMFELKLKSQFILFRCLPLSIL